MMIQQGVSVGGLGPTASASSLDADNDGMTIGRVMDWIEARLEAIKTQEDEEDEEEEKEREKERTRPTSSAPPNHNKPAVPSPSPPSLVSAIIYAVILTLAYPFYVGAKFFSSHPKFARDIHHQPPS